MDDKELSALKALAEAANLNDWPFHGIAFQKAANPAAILSLISRLESADLLGEHYEKLCQSKDARIAGLESQLDRAESTLWRAGFNGDSVQGFTAPVSPSPAVDLGGLTGRLHEALQWALAWIDAVPRDTALPAMPGFDRDYVNDLLATSANRVKLSDVQAILATPACDVGGLTDSVQFLRNVVADAASMLRTLDIPKAADLLEVAVKGIEREVLATKEAEPVRAEVRNAALAMLDAAFNKEIERVSSLDYPANSMCRTFYAKLRESFATSPAPSVKQEAVNAEQIARKVRELTLDYAAMHFDGKSRLISPAYVSEYLRELKNAPLDVSVITAAPSASQGEVKVPEGFALVPKDPTPEMVHAARFYSGELPTTAATCYRAMIAAATAPSVMDGEKK